MAVKDQIDSILAERKKKADRLRQSRESVKTLQSYIASLESYKKEVENLPDAEIRSDYASEFGSISTGALRKELQRYNNLINNAIARFERDHIAIATVGMARQGKSRFLQAVGNLGNEIIPAYDASDCTGATSVIYNRPEMAPETVSVLITFKQQSDLVKTVKEYIKQIDPSSPYLTSEFGFYDIDDANIITELKGKIRNDEAEKSIALKHLQDIIDNFDEISPLFGSHSITLTDPELIKSYVAQNNGKKATDPDVEYYYNYLAVGRAEISCRFYEDCGKIVLVDTIGIGDTQVGIDKAMLDTVDKLCDAAIVVTKPISDVHDPDIKLYQTLRDNFSDRAMGKWLFYIANLHKGVNDNAVDAFLNGVKNNNFDICFCKKVDCSDKDAVNNDFMMPLLDTLTRNMDEIDAKYLENINSIGSKLINMVNKMVTELPEIKEKNVGQAIAQQAFMMGQKTYKDMTAQLKSQVSDWSKKRNQSNGALWSKVQVILNKMDSVAPSADELQEIINKNGAMMPNALWEAACNYVRNEITDSFNEIDGAMQKETLEFKNSLVKHMYYALNNIFSQQTSGSDEGGDDVDMLAWLKNMMDNVIGGQEQYTQIYKAFQFLYNFEFSIKENVIQEVRKQLYTLNPLAEDYYVPPQYVFRASSAGDEVHYYLTSRLAVIEDELRHSLSQLYRRPNQTFYAAAEEFYDRITFAINFDNKSDENSFTDMSMVWGNFFMQYSQKLWEDNADRYKDVNEIITKYNGTKLLMRDMAGTLHF